MGVTLSQAKRGLKYEKLEEARKDPAPVALEGGWPCRHLALGPLVSRL